MRLLRRLEKDVAHFREHVDSRRVRHLCDGAVVEIHADQLGASAEIPMEHEGDACWRRLRLGLQRERGKPTENFLVQPDDPIGEV